MRKTIIKFTYERKGKITWEQKLTRGRSDWNTCTKSVRLWGLNNSQFEQSKVEVSAECYCKYDEKLLRVKSYQKFKILLQYITLSVTQPSAAVFRGSARAADTDGNQKIIIDWNIYTKSTDCKG